MRRSARFTAFALLFLTVLCRWTVHRAAGYEDPYDTGWVWPPDYETFRPPAAGQTYLDPTFGTEIKVITDAHGIVGWNGERSMFSQDDRFFAVGMKPYAGAGMRLRIYDGRTGAFYKDVWISNWSEARWCYDPEVLVYPTGRELRGHNVVTGADWRIKQFESDIGTCGGDGNDFDDSGEWLLLGLSSVTGQRMFAYNVRTGERGPEFSVPSTERVDYATISPSGNYIVVLQSGFQLYTRNGVWVRELCPAGGHMDLGYLNGTQECLVAKIGSGNDSWKAQWGLNTRERYAAVFETGQVVKLTLAGTIYAQYSAVGGSNRRYLYAAMECDGDTPGNGWERYAGEIIEIPLDGSRKVRRLLHHRARPHNTEPHTWEDQPEPWINHAGDRLFFRSNMCMEQGANGQTYGNDLYFVKIPPRDGETVARIGTGADDAEEQLATGAVSLNSSDLELVRDGSNDQLVGLRFPDLQIPADSTVLSASLTFKTDESSTETTALEIRAQATDNAASFTTAAYNLSSRARTAASTAWQPDGWSTIGKLRESPDIAPVIQEVLDRTGWQAGNALALLVDGSGRRVAESYEGSASGAPLLRVVWRPTPAIAVSTTNISVYAPQGSHCPDTTFQVWNSLGGVLEYDVVESTSKFDVSPTSGSSTAPDSKRLHTLSFSTASLLEGSYERTLTIQDAGSGARNGPITIAVHIEIGPPPPNAPSGFAAAPVSPTSVRLTWHDLPDETHYMLRQSLDGSYWYDIDAVYPPLDATGHTVTGLDANTRYYFKLRGVNDSGQGPYCAPVSIKIAESLTDAPTGFTATPVSGSTVRLSWNDLPDETGYMLRRSLNGYDWYDFPAVYPAADTTAYTATGLDPETIWYFKVRGVNDVGSGPYCAPVSATTPRANSGSFTAYNDLCWAAGQTVSSITRIGRSQSGLLVDHAGGALLPVMLTVNSGGGTETAYGEDAAAGTEAAQIFGGIVDGRGVLAYAQTELALTIGGLDSARLYELVLFGNRAKNVYTARTTKLTLEGAASFVNSSSAGATVTTTTQPDDTTTIVNGANTANGFVARYDQIEPGADGSIRVRLPAWDGASDAGRYYLNALRLRTVEPPAPTLARGALWRYRKGTAEASTPATAWREVAFDDAGWAEGPAPIGYGTPAQGGTVLSDMRYNYTSVFLRRTLNVDDPTLVGAIELEVDYDDGFILWINGREVARVNVAGEPGSFVPCNATASANGNGTAQISLTGAQLPDLLPGANAIAAQVFNISVGGSSDCAFDAQVNVVTTPACRTTDADQNNLPDAWEQTHLSDLTDPTDRTDQGDPDGDGVSNLEEYIAGTSPRDATGYLKLETRLQNGQLVVSFETVPAADPGYEGLTRHYALEQRAAHGAPWQIVPGYSDIVGAGQTVTHTPADTDDPLFHRARVWLEEL